MTQLLMDTPLTECQRSYVDAVSEKRGARVLMNALTGQIRQSGSVLLGVVNGARLAPAHWPTTHRARERAEILDYSKIEAGHMEITPRPFFLHRMLQAMETLCQAQGVTRRVQRRNALAFTPLTRR
jgi:hypothetical protein